MMSTHIGVYCFIKRVDLRLTEPQREIDHARISRTKNRISRQSFDDQSRVWHGRRSSLKDSHKANEVLAGSERSSYRKEIIILRVEAYKTPNHLAIDIVTEAFSFDRMGNTKNMWMMLLNDAHAVF